MEPFLRWAGGKSWLIKHLNEIIGDFEINHYHEPFLGGGAIFFSTEHRLRSYLSDTNEDLVQAYIAVRDVPDDVIRFFEQFQNTEEQYYFIRAQKYENPAQCAAQFIFLNQTSYNGIYRVNADGQYNVPYGFRTRFEYDVQRILNASIALRNTNIKYSLLDKLSKDTIISIVLFSHAIFMIIQVFRRKTKGCAPYNLWFIELPPWFIPSVVCICFVALLLLQTSC